jgi:hypothetical protein
MKGVIIRGRVTRELLLLVPEAASFVVSVSSLLDSKPSLASELVAVTPIGRELAALLFDTFLATLSTSVELDRPLSRSVVGGSSVMGTMVLPSVRLKRIARPPGTQGVGSRSRDVLMSASFNPDSATFASTLSS